MIMGQWEQRGEGGANAQRRFISGTESPCPKQRGLSHQDVCRVAQIRNSKCYLNEQNQPIWEMFPNFCWKRCCWPWAMAFCKARIVRIGTRLFPSSPRPRRGWGGRELGRRRVKLPGWPFLSVRPGPFSTQTHRGSMCSALTFFLFSLPLSF